MTVTSVNEDRTWLIHLDAPLALQDSKRATNQRFACLPPLGRSSGSSPDISAVRDVPLIINSAIVQLRSIALEMESLFGPYHKPRQLDVRKTLTAIRKVRRNVDLVAALGPDPAHDVLCSALDLVLSVVHGRNSSYLGRVSEEQYLAVDKVCCRKMESATDRVLSGGRHLAEALRTDKEVMADTNTIRRPTTLEVIWALRAVLLSPLITQDQRRSTQQQLMTIGERTRIPMALTEVSPDTPNKTVA